MVRLSTDDDLTDFDKKVLPTLEEWGWYVISVADKPVFSYSVGLFEHFKHPEIIVFGLDSSTTPWSHQRCWETDTRGTQIRHWV